MPNSQFSGANLYAKVHLPVELQRECILVRLNKCLKYDILHYFAYKILCFLTKHFLFEEKKINLKFFCKTAIVMSHLSLWSLKSKGPTARFSIFCKQTSIPVRFMVYYHFLFVKPFTFLPNNLIGFKILKKTFQIAKFIQSQPFSWHVIGNLATLAR